MHERDLRPRTCDRVLLMHLVHVARGKNTNNQDKCTREKDKLGWNEGEWVRAPKICAKQILTLRRDPMLKNLLPADILCCSLGPQNMSKNKRRNSNAKKEMLHDRYSKLKQIWSYWMAGWMRVIGCLIWDKYMFTGQIWDKYICWSYIGQIYWLVRYATNNGG